MFKTYLRQAVRLLAQNKFISFIAILGTALSIMMIMCLIVVDRLKNGDLPPENNRSKTLYVTGYLNENKEKGSISMGYPSFQVQKEYLEKLETPTYKSLVSPKTEASHVKRDAQSPNHLLEVRLTDAAFWEIYQFDFLGGRGYAQPEFESGMAQAVLSHSVERELYGTESGVGKFLTINSVPYKVVGVVKDISRIFDMSYGQIWIPYTSRAGYEKRFYRFLMTVENRSDIPIIAQELKGAAIRYEQVNPSNEMTFFGPDRQRDKDVSWAASSEEREKSKSANRRRTIFIIVILLLVPAVNLSGFSMSQISRRMAEIGVRKAFGAKKSSILFQVLYENLLTSLIGGVIGLILSYAVIFRFRFWLLGIPEDSSVPLSGLVSLPVLAAVVLACLLMNLLSVGIPAYRASKLSIIHSLNQNER